MKYTFNGKTPNVDESAFIAPGAHVVGDVTIGEGASIWFNSVLRGDEGPISIGKKQTFKTTAPFTCMKATRLS